MKIGTQATVVRSIQTLFSVGSVGGMTDGQLLEEFLSRRDEGAEAAFAALVALHGPMVWRVCQNVLADSHAAEDAFQATFLILVRKARSIGHRDALESWLYGVARRVAVRSKADAARRRKREEEAAETNSTHSPAPDALQRERLELLHREVERLPEKYRVAVVLCHLQGRTHAEAARLLKCPVGTVSVRVSRARDILKDRLTRRGLVFPAALPSMTLFSDSASASLVPGGLIESTIKIAMLVATRDSMAAGVVPAAVAQLTEGVIDTMSMTIWKFTAGCVLVTGTAAAGAGLLAGAIGPAQGNLGGGAVPAPPAQTDEDDPQAVATARMQSVDNLKHIALAMHNFASKAQPTAFPAAAIRKDGKPLLSWRVALLPFLDEQELYDKFHLDEPWDSPHNKTLLDQMPDFYAPVIHNRKLTHSTYYQVFVGPGSLFGGADGPKFQDITDGTSLTLMVVEAAKAVPWTKPEDLPYNPEKPLPELGFFKDGFNAAFGDGSVHFLNRNIQPHVLRALITMNGHEIIRADDF